MSEPSKPTHAEEYEAIEHMFEHYREWKARRDALKLRVGLRGKSYVTVGVQSGFERHEEAIMAEAADLDKRVQACEVCLAALTRREQTFVESRYFDGLSLRMAARSLGASERVAYRLRGEVLEKCRRVLSGGPWQAFGSKMTYTP